VTDADRDGVDELTYPLGAAARLTGLNPDTIRAWERRYHVVVPQRTTGGTRRYTAADLERLRLVKAAVDAGHRIGQVAALGADALRSLSRSDGSSEADSPSDVCDPILAALERLDAVELERRVALQLSALGPRRFASRVASPLLERIGESWSQGRLSVAAEHMASSLLRSLLGASLRPGPTATSLAPIVFATLEGERHELGLLIAAITAAAAGAHVVYLGPDLPVDDLVGAAGTAQAGAVALSVVGSQPAQALTEIQRLRAQLPSAIEVWVGGSGSSVAREVKGVSVLGSLEALEDRVRLLALGSGRPGVA